MTIEDERKTAGNAKAVLSTLTPATPRTDALVHSLRTAASAATNASNKTLSSASALNNARGEAATALNGAAGLLHRGELTEEMIARARAAVAAWLLALDVQGG
jgi:hypothetical protein